MSGSIDRMIEATEREKIESFKKANSELAYNFELVINNYKKTIIHNNRPIYESALEYYNNTTSANLNGKNYYGYLLKNPKPEDYQLFF